MGEIALAPHVVFTLFDKIPVTAANLSLFLITIVLMVVSLYVSATAKMVPSSLQIVFEGILNWFGEKIDGSFQSQRARRRVTPLIITFFLMIICANLFGVLPIINDVVVEGKSLFKVPTAHLSMTLAFTLIALGITHITALTLRPIKYIGNYIKIAGFFKARTPGQFAQATLDFFLALLDLVGEIARVVSLSCRLFGNVLAGELMIIVIMGLSFYTQFLVPIPFMILGLLSGVIQAIVFSLLAMQYISLALASIED